MKIRKVLDKSLGDTSYYKYLITLPKKIVVDSGLLNKSLKAVTNNKRIYLEIDYKKNIADNLKKGEYNLEERQRRGRLTKNEDKKPGERVFTVGLKHPDESKYAEFMIEKRELANRIVEIMDKL